MSKNRGSNFDKDAINAKLIKPYGDETAKSKKSARYVPFWAYI